MTDRATVLVVGGGPAGLTAAIFTARAGLATVVVDAGTSALSRAAHVENVPGFPAGVDPRLLLHVTAEQAGRAGADRREAEVVGLDREDEGFRARTADGGAIPADRVVCASGTAADYLADLPGVRVVDRPEPIVEADHAGRTALPGLYAAGRLAGRPDHAVVAAGHGAEVALALLEDAEGPFDRDWVAPAGYFTDRGLAVPAGTEEVAEEERAQREWASLSVMQRHFAAPHPGDPAPPPEEE